MLAPSNFAVISKPQRNMIIKFFGRKSSVNESKIFYNGGHYLWWPKVSECWVRSSPIGWIIYYMKIYMITLLCIAVQLAKLCVWNLILESRIAERLIFAASNMTKWRELVRNPEPKALQILMWLALLFFTISWNFRPLSIASASWWKCSEHELQLLTRSTKKWNLKSGSTEINFPGISSVRESGPYNGRLIFD